MSTALACGLALALASALALDTGFLLQQAAASALPELSLRHPLASARSLLASRRWFAGFWLGIGGWACYFAALSLAPLSLVQTVAASSIGLLVVLVALARHALPLRHERIGAILATTGLMALAGSIGRAAEAPGHSPPALALVALGAAVVAFAGLALRRRSAALGGLAAGLCYGAGDVTSKAMLLALPHHPTAAALATSPLLYATAGAHGAGFVLVQRAFQHGGAVAALGPMTAATNLLPMAAGVVLLGERLPSADAGIALRLVAFGAAVAGAWVLAVRRAPSMTAQPPGGWIQPTFPTAAG